MNRIFRNITSEAWLAAAEDALLAAISLKGEGRYRSSVSRAYYAAYSFLAAILIRNPGVSFIDDREGPRHEQLSDMVSQYLKREFGPDVRSRIRTSIRALYESRLLADYRPRQSISESMAVEVLRSATMIAVNVRKVLQ